eukprot:scaffold11166_cov101-Isochrysis_galbana.AAC.3
MRPAASGSPPPKVADSMRAPPVDTALAPGAVAGVSPRPPGTASPLGWRGPYAFHVSRRAGRRNPAGSAPTTSMLSTSSAVASALPAWPGPK